MKVKLWAETTVYHVVLLKGVQKVVVRVELWVVSMVTLMALTLVALKAVSMDDKLVRTMVATMVDEGADNWVA